jgi:hypothetical protein
MMNQGPKKTEDSAEVEVEVEVETGNVARSAPRKTLAGRVIGYTGMDPPPAFDSIIEDSSSGGVGGEDTGVGEVSMSRADIEMIEYERIKSMRRKRGTLKKNHKPQPQAEVVADEDGVED